MITVQPDREELTYSERYVAFVDILGFGDIVAQSATNPRQAAALAEVLKGLPARNKSYDDTFADDFKLLQFSDSIIMSSAASHDGLFHLMVSVSDIALSLLKKGLLVRGGLAKGPLYHSNQLAFGPAFIDAYKIE